MHYLDLAIGWALYYALHSVLADLKVKGFAQRVAPNLFRFYRLGYVVFATVGFVGMVWLQLQSANQLLFPVPGWLWTVGLIVMAGGGWIVLDSFKAYNTREFIGFEQLNGAAPEHSMLVTTGWNRLVRHPLYFGTLVAVLGYWIYAPGIASSIFAGISIAYLIVGAVLEERKLVAQFGQQYRSYQQNVRMLIPFIF